MGRSRGFAELHLHLYGTIRPGAFLDYVSERDVDWGYYEHTYEQAYGTRPPVADLVERHRRGDAEATRAFHELFVFGDADGGNFERFQAKFNLLISGSELVRLHRYDDPIPPLLAEMDYFVRHMLDEQRREGVGYAEQRMLLSNAFPAASSRRIMQGILDTYRREDARGGLQPRLAVGCDRADPWPSWELAKELALGPDGHLVTGIDFCNVEEGFPPKDKATFFKTVCGWNDQHPERALAILYHVGESFADKSLESAVRWVQEAAELGAHRLGHAIALAVDPDAYGDHVRSESAAERLDQIAYDLLHADALERVGVRIDKSSLARERRVLESGPADAQVQHTYDAARRAEVRRRQDFAMERVRATGAVIEVCPTSNRRIGDIADPVHHPVHRFLDAGLPVVIGTDDPGIFDTRPADELAWVVEHAALPPEAFDDLAENAWRYRSELLTGRKRT